MVDSRLTHPLLCFKAQGPMAPLKIWSFEGGPRPPSQSPTQQHLANTSTAGGREWDWQRLEAERPANPTGIPLSLVAQDNLCLET